MSILATILYGVGGFIILVFFHEFGHFLMAKWGGVGVEEFSVGMGKALWKKRYKGTLYKIGLVPFGGYCKLKGQDDFGPVKPSVEQDNYFSRPPAVRFLISFGGPFFSYLLGFIFLALSLFMQGENKLMLTKISTTPQNAILQDGDLIKAVGGKEVSDWQALQTELLSSNQTGVQVTLIRNGQQIEVTYVPDMEKNELITYHDTVSVNRVEEGFPAQAAGFQKGDQIVFINGKKVNDNLDLIYLVQWETVPLVYRTFARALSFGFISELSKKMILPIEVTLKRQENFYTKKLTPRLGDAGQKLVGIDISIQEMISEKYFVNHPLSITGALGRSFSQSVSYIVLSFKSIIMMVKGRINMRKSGAGPVKIFKTLGQTGSYGGFWSFLGFAGVISIALAFFNFIPFPALDGGHMLLSVIEMITKKRINPKVLSVIQVVGIMFLFGVLIYFTYNDILNW